MAANFAIKLDYERPAPPQVRRAPLQMRGFVLDHVELQTADAYEFHSVGDRHYLALHDLALDDGELKIEGCPTVRETALRGTLTFVPKGREISGWAKPVERANSFTALTIDAEAVNDELAQRFTTDEPEPLIYSRDPDLVSTMTKLSALANSSAPDLLYAETLCLAASLEIFGALAAPRGGRLSASQMRRVADGIEERLASDLSLDVLAAMVGLSRFHFSRAFKASFGMGAHRYVEERRVQRAQHLLQHRPSAADDVGPLVGFASATAFRRAFVRNTGLTPAGYRRTVMS